MTDQLAEFRPDWVSPPGDTIADLIEEQGWSQAEFAERSGYTTKHVNQLIAGKASINEDTAFRLERVLGSSATFWLSREAQYREALARVTERDALASSVDWLKEIPLAHMIKFKWVPTRRDKTEQVAECLRFFGVASVDVWRNKYGEAVESFAAYRSSLAFEKKLGSVAAWLRQGERAAADISCEPFEKTRFESLLADLRALTNESGAEFVGRLVSACARVGVAVVLAPAPPGCPITGATKWLTPSKALLMLSLRYKSNDHLWFAFFHEAGHLVLHGKKMLFLETSGKGMDDEAEQQANDFAANLLIPPVHAKALPYLARTHAAVEAFASSIGIAPGIVVGRMVHDRLMPPSYLQDLKVFYRWKE